MRRLALAASVLLAPVLASAQSTRSYTAVGCDYARPDLFGPGPRACGTAYIDVRRTDAFPNFEQLSISISLTGYTGFEGGFSPNAFTPAPDDVLYRDDLDGFGFLSCFDDLCRGTHSVGSLMLTRVPIGYTPTGVYIGYISYYGDAIPTGVDARRYGPGLASGFELYVTPEPATLALTLGGLAVLGAVFRRRTA